MCFHCDVLFTTFSPPGSGIRGIRRSSFSAEEGVGTKAFSELSNFGITVLLENLRGIGILLRNRWLPDGAVGFRLVFCWADFSDVSENTHAHTHTHTKKKRKQKQSKEKWQARRRESNNMGANTANIYIIFMYIVYMFLCVGIILT